MIFKRVRFIVHEKVCIKIEKQNNISINVFGCEDEIPYCIYTSKQTFEKHLDLLLLSNSKNFHYVLIRNFNRFMANKTKHHGQKFFVDIPSNPF